MLLPGVSSDCVFDWPDKEGGSRIEMISLKQATNGGNEERIHASSRQATWEEAGVCGHENYSSYFLIWTGDL